MNSLPQEEKYFPVPEPETNFSVFGNESKIVPEGLYNTKFGREIDKNCFSKREFIK